MSPLGPRGGLKAFCSKTVHLQFIASFFQRAEADRASHGFQRKSATQTNVCRLHCQLLSHEKKSAWGAGSKMQETQFFSTGQSISLHKGLPKGEAGASHPAALKLSKKNPLLAPGGETALRGLPHDRNPLYRSHI